MTRHESVDEGRVSQSKFGRTRDTETLASVPWREVNMKASSNSTDIKQTQNTGPTWRYREQMLQLNFIVHG